jgi:hypothetical protein
MPTKYYVTSPPEYYITSPPVVALWLGIYHTAMTYDMFTRRLTVQAPELPAQTVTTVGTAGPLWQ